MYELTIIAQSGNEERRLQVLVDFQAKLTAVALSSLQGRAAPPLETPLLLLRQLWQPAIR